MGVLSSKNTIRVSELGPERLGLGRFAGQRGFARFNPALRKKLGEVQEERTFREEGKAGMRAEYDSVTQLHGEARRLARQGGKMAYEQEKPRCTGPVRLDRLLDLRPAKPTGPGTGWTGC